MKSITLAIIILLAGWQPVASQGENLFDDSYLHEVRFTGMDTTLIDGSKVYQMVNMTVDGITLDSIGIKEKGNISRFVANLKVPLKIKTNKYVPGKKIDGIKEFMLHNNYQDPTMMREKITYDICEQLGFYALRTAYAKVYINDRYWGLYTLVEGKDEMFKQVFGDRDAEAIESLDFGDMCYISDNPGDYDIDVSGLPYYKLENGDRVRAFDLFAGMIDKANNTPDENYVDTVTAYLNLEDFFKYLAMNVYLMNMDSYIAFRGNQIYMYDSVAGVFQVIPWDFNGSLGLWNTNNYTPDSYPVIPDVISTGCIATKMNTFPVLKAYYLNAMCRMVHDYCDPSEMNARIDGWKGQIQEAVYADWRKEFTNEDFDQSLETGYFEYNYEDVPALKTFFAERYSVISAGLEEMEYTCTVSSSGDLIGDDSADGAFARIRLFPNPVSGSFFIDSDEPVEQVVIFNSMGQMIVEVVHPGCEVDVSYLRPGIYVVLFNLSGRVTSRRILVE